MTVAGAPDNRAAAGAGVASGASGIAAAADAASVHATALVIGETGVLIRGASGSGKSTLARRLLERAAESGRFARLVGDDRITLSLGHGRILARTVAAIAGLLEVRGVGIVRVPYLPAAVVDLVVDCDVRPDRLPAACDKMTDLLGVQVPMLAVAGRADAADVVFWLVAQGASTKV